MLEIKLKAERAMNRHSGTESGCSTEANDQKCVHKCKLQLHFVFFGFVLFTVVKKKTEPWRKKDCAHIGQFTQKRQNHDDSRGF